MLFLTTVELHQSELMILQFSDSLNKVKRQKCFLKSWEGIVIIIQTDVDFFSYDDEKIHKNKHLLKVPG